MKKRESKVATEFARINLRSGTVNIECDGIQAKLDIDAKGNVIFQTHENVARMPETDMWLIGRKIKKPGDRMSDGSIYGGLSPNTERPFYVAAADEPEPMALWFAKEQAYKSRAHGTAGWRVPTHEELLMMCNNKREGAFKDTFNERGGFCDKNGRYASSRNGLHSVWWVRFRDGFDHFTEGYNKYNFRFVRDGFRDSLLAEPKIVFHANQKINPAPSPAQKVTAADGKVMIYARGDVWCKPDVPYTMGR